MLKNYQNKGNTILPLILSVVWCHNETIYIAKHWYHTTVGIKGSIVWLQFYVTLVLVVF